LMKMSRQWRAMTSLAKPNLSNAENMFVTRKGISRRIKNFSGENIMWCIRQAVRECQDILCTILLRGTVCFWGLSVGLYGI
jgi:hypothetical protein